VRGHDALREMRLQGATPLDVTVIDGPPTWACSEWAGAFPASAVIAIDTHEPLHSLDLRCLVGLPVQVSSNDEKRLGQLLRRIKAESPARLIGVHYDTNPGEARMLAVYDSEGLMTWRKH